MKRFLHVSFLCPAILFTVHQVLQKVLLIHISFVDSYLDPFCFGALVPALYTFERNRMTKNDQVGFAELLALTFVLVIFSEYLLPLLSLAFTFDYADMLMIVLGVLWFRVFS